MLLNSLIKLGKKRLSGGRAGAVASITPPPASALEESDDASPPLTLVDATAAKVANVETATMTQVGTTLESQDDSSAVKQSDRKQPPTPSTTTLTNTSIVDTCAAPASNPFPGMSTGGELDAFFITCNTNDGTTTSTVKQSDRKDPPPMKPNALQHGTTNAVARPGQLKNDGPPRAHGPYATGNKENTLPLLSGLKIHDGNHSPLQTNPTPSLFAGLTMRGSACYTPLQKKSAAAAKVGTASTLTQAVATLESQANKYNKESHLRLERLLKVQVDATNIAVATQEVLQEELDQALSTNRHQARLAKYKAKSCEAGDCNCDALQVAKAALEERTTHLQMMYDGLMEDHNELLFQYLLDDKEPFEMTATANLNN